MSNTNDINRNTKRIENKSSKQEQVTKNKYDMILEDVLMGDESPNKEFYEKQLKNCGTVSPVEFKNIGPKCKIVLSEEVNEKLLQIQQTSFKCEKEAAFYLFGIEKDGIIYLNKIIHNFKGNTSYESDYNPIVDSMYNYLQERRDLTYDINNYDNKFYTSVICRGHTHLKIENQPTDHFSKRDLIALIKQREKDEIVHFGTRTLSMLLTPTGDYNFIYYENNDLFKGIYKYNNVFVIGTDKKLIKLPAYQNGNYLKDETKGKSK